MELVRLVSSHQMLRVGQGGRQAYRSGVRVVALEDMETGVASNFVLSDVQAAELPVGAIVRVTIEVAPPQGITQASGKVVPLSATKPAGEQDEETDRPQTGPAEEAGQQSGAVSVPALESGGAPRPRGKR